NKIGVVSKWFDIRAGEKDIEGYINESNCRYIIAFDMLLPKIKMIIDKTCLERVLVINPADSLGKASQIAYTVKSKIGGNYYPMPNDKRYMGFQKFIKQYDNGKDLPCVAFDKNRPSVMIQSSGTTGKPKVIVHSDFSATSCVKKLAFSDLPLGKNKVLLNLLPPWIAYALGEATLYPLALGTKVILCPTFDSDALMKYLGKFTISFAAPFHYRYLLDNFNDVSKKKKQLFYKMSDGFVSGGDKITVEENMTFDNSFKAPLANGYGNNEGWGCLTVNSMKKNKYGSVGIPKYGETIISYDNEAGKELPYGQVGEICVLADTMFLYYEGNAEETANVKKTHSDGKVWLHTGDLGYIDEEGYIFLQGRLRRVIVRKGFKISAYTIEDKICEHPAVKECVAVEAKDDEEEHVPMAFIVLKDDITDDLEIIKQSILEKCKSELKEYEIPKHFQFIDSLPYTQNGKYDFRLLEKQGNEYVDKL
ncbi:MAG: fatty acid--CoA ligase family protein, partial [Clostridia bacterium]|nr:fatty acid--CoA ligase family protein [Clostridia bacterium]